MSYPPRLLIADYPPARLGVRMALDDLVMVCAEVDDAEGAILAAERAQPDICIVGLEIPGNGLAAVKGIVSVAPQTSVIVIAGASAGSGTAGDLLASIRAGAVGYVPGGFDGEQLQRVVRAVLANEAAVPRSMVHELVLELRSATTPDGGVLSTRETQVLSMVRRGRSTAAIACELEISPVTVRRHISVLVSKLGVPSRAELIASDASR